MKTGKPEETSLDSQEKKSTSAPRSAGGSYSDGSGPLDSWEPAWVHHSFAGVNSRTQACPNGVSK